MAYTHHNNAMTSAHNTIQHLWCTSHGIVMMSVSHFLVSRLFGASLSHSYTGNVFTSSPYGFCLKLIVLLIVPHADGVLVL